MKDLIKVSSPFGNYTVAEEADEVVKGTVKDAVYMIKDESFTLCLVPATEFGAEDRAFIYYVDDVPYRIIFTNKYDDLIRMRRLEEEQCRM